MTQNTDSAAMAAQIEKLETRYRALFENTTNGVAVYMAVNKGADFVFVDFNKAAEKIEDIKREEVIGRLVSAVFPGVETFGLLDVLRKVWQTGQAVHHPVHMYEDRRVLGWRENYVYKLPTGEVVAIYSDETERMQMEEALRASEAHLRNENIRLKNTFKDRYKFGDIVGRSQPMQMVYDLILQAAASDANVIIYGESGTGKELAARAIHQMSERASRPFVPVNCGAVPESILESELFGYKKGAFTGAVADKQGYLDTAAGGTLFLDEVGEIGPSMQVKLLRAIEGRGYTPVGGHAVKTPDIRIIAATHQDLARMVEEGRIRSDFFYRIHIIPIHLPPLRERRGDITLLAYHFLSAYTRGQDEPPPIPSQVMAALRRHDWPGNVRELQNVIHRYITLGEMDFMGAPRLADELQERMLQDKDWGEQDLDQAVKAFEKAYIERVLTDFGGNRSRTARALGIDRRTLQRKMKSLGLA